VGTKALLSEKFDEYAGLVLLEALRNFVFVLEVFRSSPLLVGWLSASCLAVSRSIAVRSSQILGFSCVMKSFA
jgi:hypothetical protein